MQIHVSDERITLLTYKPHIAIDTIVEAGDYELMIRHDRDIHAIQLWRNGKKVKRPKFKDNRPTAALYRSLRTWMVRPTLRFGPQTVYLIQVQLEGESSERVYRLMTRPPNRPRPPKNELGIPIGQTD
ncbi:MAG TPA: hypothetical protein PKA53_12610 [Sphingobacterium sp.]|nr:hypothetical protein [Sphingobacterium sp.]